MTSGTARRPDAAEPTAHADLAGLDDAGLLERIGEGDHGAFETLYRRYHRRLIGYLLRFLGTPSAADETLDDVMFAVWNGAHRFDGRSRPSTWIFGIAYNKAMKTLERRRRFDERHEPRDEDAPEPPAEGSGPEDRLRRRELRRRLREAMGHLSPTHRAVVELTFFYGYSYPEIADIVDCPVNTVKTRMFHARRRLKERLPELGIDRGEIS